MIRRGLLFVSAALFALGCRTERPPEKKAQTKPVEYFHVDAATAGTLHGRVTYRGPKPAREAIVMDSDAGCEQANHGRKVYDPSIIVGQGGGLANAFVYIRSGLEGKTFEPAKEPVVIDQRGCMFIPRVIAARAGQTLDVKNSDPVSHNIHPMPANNREWSQQQSPDSPDLEHRFPRPEVMIPVKCNVHSWMHAYIAIMEHPYFAVTSDGGAFEIRNLPPGDYTLAVWHEKLGDQTKPVHVAPSSSAAVDFTFEKGR